MGKTAMDELSRKPCPEEGAPLPGQTPPPVREEGRIGMFTLGVCLIGCGALLLCSLFFSSFSFLFLARFAPVVLILLGGEVLASYFLSRGKNITYHFFNTFLCLLLAGICLFISFIPTLFAYYGPEKNRAEGQAEQALYQKCSAALGQDSDIEALSTVVYLLERRYPDPFQISDFSGGDSLIVSVQLAGSYADKEAFCEKAQAVFSALSKAGLPPFSCTVSYQGDTAGYQLIADDSYAMALPTEKLLRRVDLLYSSVEGS